MSTANSDQKISECSTIKSLYQANACPHQQTPRCGAFIFFGHYFDESSIEDTLPPANFNETRSLRPTYPNPRAAVFTCLLFIMKFVNCTARKHSETANFRQGGRSTKYDVANKCLTKNRFNTVPQCGAGARSGFFVGGTTEGSKVESEGGVPGEGVATPPHQLGGPGSAVSSPAGFGRGGARPPPKSFPLFPALRMACPDTIILLTVDYHAAIGGKTPCPLPPPAYAAGVPDRPMLIIPISTFADGR